MKRSTHLFWGFLALSAWLGGGRAAMAEESAGDTAVQDQIDDLKAEVAKLKSDGNSGGPGGVKFDTGSWDVGIAGFAASRYSFSRIDGENEFQLTKGKFGFDMQDSGTNGAFGGELSVSGGTDLDVMIDEGYATVDWTRFFDFFPKAITGFKWSLGRMNAPIEYESFDETDTPGITHSYNYIYGTPNKMTGLKIALETEYVEVFGYYINGPDRNLDNNAAGNREKHWSGNLVLKPATGFAFTASWLVGNDDADDPAGYTLTATNPRPGRRSSAITHIWDLIADFDFSSFDLGALSGLHLVGCYNSGNQAAGSEFDAIIQDRFDSDGDLNTTEFLVNPLGIGMADGTWDGFAGYFMYDLSYLAESLTNWKFGYRYEYLNDEDGLLTFAGAPAAISKVHATDAFKPAHQRLDAQSVWLQWTPSDHFDLRIEFRRDSTDSDGRQNFGLLAASAGTGIGINPTTNTGFQHKDAMDKTNDRITLQVIFKF